MRVIGEWASPPLAATVEASGTLDQLREFAIHRSAYQLKEADAHTFAIPRLRGSGRSAMIEIQTDEYGSGRPGEAHAELFADAMRELGLPTDFGRFVESMPYVRAYPQDLPVMRDLLPTIETPVQIIAGARDQVVPPVNAEYLHKRLPKSKLDLLDTGHFTWEDGADQYATLVTSWWAGGYAKVERRSS